MGDAGLPYCEQEVVEGKEVNLLAPWKLMKDVLADMIVEGCEMSAIDGLRILVRTQGENHLSLVHQAQMIFQTIEVPI